MNATGIEPATTQFVLTKWLSLSSCGFKSRCFHLKEVYTYLKMENVKINYWKVEPENIYFHKIFRFQYPSSDDKTDDFNNTNCF